MTRRRLILLALAGIALVALGLRPWEIAVGRVQGLVADSLRTSAGLEVSSVERAGIALLPLPHIKLRNVVFSGDGGRVHGRAPEVVVRPRLTSLAAGNVRFERVDLRRPEIDLSLAAQDNAPRDWIQGILDSLGRVARGARIVIQSGALLVRHGETVGTIVRDVNLVMDERLSDEPVRLHGSVNWRGVATTVNVSWPVTGTRSRASVLLRSAIAEVTLDGERLVETEPLFQGQFRFETKTLGQSLSWAGTAPRLASAFDALSLNAAIRLTAREASLSQVLLTVDGQPLEGALTIGLGRERWSLSGTLAGASLDLGRLYQRLDIKETPNSPAGETPLDFADWTSHDVDVRVSIDTARIGTGRLNDVATQLLVAKGRFEAALLRAGAYGGSIRGRLLAAPAPAGVDVKLQASMERVSLAQAATAMPALARITGTAAAQLNLESTGRNVEQLREAASGKLSVSLRGGEITGLAFSDLMRRGDRNPLAVLRDWRQGKSAFETATVQALVQNGAVVIPEASMAAAQWRLMLSGTGSLLTRTLDLEGAVTGTQGTPRLPLTLRGPIDDPAVAIDGAAFLREPAAFVSPIR